MQSEAKDLVTKLKGSNIRKSQLRSFALYEEYSQRTIDETIRKREENYYRVNLETKTKLERG
jgi:hypothetical protein